MLSRGGLFGSRHVLPAIAGCAALQLAYTHAAPLQETFGSTHLAADEWLRVVAAAAFVFCTAELKKQVTSVRRGPYGEASPASQS